MLRHTAALTATSPLRLPFDEIGGLRAFQKATGALSASNDELAAVHA